MDVRRRKFQGVLNILSFNRHFYIIGLLVLAIIWVCNIVFDWPAVVFGMIGIAFLYGFMMPLFVSAWVYDFSAYYKFNWLQKHISEKESIEQIVNINAGFDETSFLLKQLFPSSTMQVFDFYNPKKHTEPAIVRARKVSLVYPNTRQITTGSIPLPNATVDLVFLLSAAHEIRSHEEKVLFLKECHRICKPNGKVIMVEHLRDFPNFLAFSIGLFLPGYLAKCI